MSHLSRAPRIASVLVAAVFVAAPAFAGPPLLCFPFDTGGAKSLPMGTANWRAIDPSYDVAHLVDDTVTLLTPETPVIARMETIRRATIYAATNANVASALLDALQARAGRPGADAPQAVFDFGYLVETYKQAKFMFATPVKGLDTIDGYTWVAKAYDLRRDPTMKYAATLINTDHSRPSLK